MRTAPQLPGGPSSHNVGAVGRRCERPKQEEEKERGSSCCPGGGEERTGLGRWCGRGRSAAQRRQGRWRERPEEDDADSRAAELVQR